MTRLPADFEDSLRMAAARDLNITFGTDSHAVGTFWCELADRADLMAVATCLSSRDARLAMITASQPPAPEAEEDEKETEDGAEAPIRELPMTFGGTPLDGRSYEVVYHFILRFDAVNLIAHVPEGGSLPSLTRLFRPADWPEREIMELYGLSFTDHPDPRRLFLDASIEPAVFGRLIPFSTLVNASSTDDLWNKVMSAAKAGA